MAKLYEYQGKEILKQNGIKVPDGQVFHSFEDLKNNFEQISEQVVIKGQAWVTGRAGLGLIKYASTQHEVLKESCLIFGKQINQQSIKAVLIEELLEVEQEFYVGVIIDDLTKSPAVIFASKGGTGIEEIKELHPNSISILNVDFQQGLQVYEARNLVRKVGIHGKLQLGLADIIMKLFYVAKKYHARAVEINPIILTKKNELYAADCRITIDDNAVNKFPELGIEVAREYDRPPTQLEKIAWQVEKKDYRGTFFFIQMEQGFEKGSRVVGFHGAGGGGSMMSMDAVINQGYHLANFVDTSGNPPASKVYRAARIILAQENIDGYFASGSGVASQEQFHSARGLVKAFMQTPLCVPAIVRLGGNAEEQAIAILDRAKPFIPAPLEAYGKDDEPDYCASRLKALIEAGSRGKTDCSELYKQEAPGSDYSFETVSGGTVHFDYSKCVSCSSKICIEKCVPGILILKDDTPTLNVTREAAMRGKCTECLACEIECFFDGNQGGYVDLPIPGLEKEG